jgi:hypothetical protein
MTTAKFPFFGKTTTQRARISTEVANADIAAANNVWVAAAVG